MEVISLSVTSASDECMTAVVVLDADWSRMGSVHAYIVQVRKQTKQITVQA